MLHQLMIKYVVEAVILLLDAAPGNARRNRRIVEDRREIEPARLPMIFPVRDRGIYFQHIDPTKHLVHGTEADLGHVLADLLGDEEEEIDHVLGLALELFPQHRILRSYAHGTRIQMALAHHDAAHRDQRGRSKAKLFGTKQRCNDDVAASLKLAVRLNANAAAQVVQQENLLRLRQAKLPRNPGMLDGT